VAITSTPADPTNQTSASFSFGDTEAGASFLCQLDRSAFSACSSPVIYLGRLSQGSHRFSVTAQDAAGNQSNAASFSWIVDTKAPPKPVLDAAEPDEPDHSQLHIHGCSEKCDLLLSAPWQSVQRLLESAELFRGQLGRTHLLSQSPGRCW
jgi:hypothetical protein